MRALVTGAAGFVGSALCDYLLDHDHLVRGVDCFTSYYARELKDSNLAHAKARAPFEFVEADLRAGDLTELLDGCDVVFHLAAQPGVRLSWADGFPLYSDHNVLATQRLLEAAKTSRVPRVVYASSSSVYGNAPAYPTSEGDLPRPHSPYGVTKLAGEHLCNLYAANWGVSTVSLRYFTVYGPRQRPDMAMHRLVSAALTGGSFPLFGTGEQVRDFTFVGDVVRATALAGAAECPPGTVINVAGSASTTMNEVVAAVESVSGLQVGIDRQPAQPGDVERTGGSIERATRLLGWVPEVDLEAGLAAQVSWHRSHADLIRSSSTPR